MEDQTTSMWTDDTRELTTGEAVKMTVIITTVVVVGTAAVYGAITGGSILWKKFQTRKAEKTNEKMEDNK